MRPIRGVAEGAQALESILLKQLFQESGAFQGMSHAGGKIYGEMFCEALANAVAQSGGMGIAKLVEGSFDKSGGAEAAGAGDADLSQHFLVGRTAVSGPPGRAATDVTPEVSSGYGPRQDPIDGSSRFHSGVDVAAQEGSPILAPAAGVVRRSGGRGGYGNAVEIDNGRGISTLYGHAHSLAVKEGDQVEAGQPIGFVGHSGRATGPHLHFEVRKDGKPGDPSSTLNRWGKRADQLIGRKP
jgi:murein DD-endopeptidase MepM/ murein hydrolase activator NlpD